MTTRSAKASEVDRKWWVVDATDQPLGRLASNIASVLRGKHKPSFTPHMDAGDFVIVVNAERVKLTGDKLQKKLYRSHSGAPGGFKERPYAWIMDNRPELAVQKAVRGMLPKNRLGRKLATKLKVYTGATHPHSAQQPEALTIRL
ncbi:MAG: 50S ribosomal protein L13 [Myxococcales bacterium]|nr:50S ribosomal protein L13 [Myxococcales bacterium]